MNRPVDLDEEMFGRGGFRLRETHQHIAAQALPDSHRDWREERFIFLPRVPPTGFEPVPPP
jgi:hypothetical protein